MITRSSVALIVVSALVFAGATWSGYAYHHSVTKVQQLAQPGWCCLPSRRTCAVTPGSEQCKAGGGIVFDWDRDACNEICASNPGPRKKAPAPSNP